jgi:hypothetical protein
MLFMSVAVDTSDRIYDDFLRHKLLFLHTHREVLALPNDIPEESVQFRFLRAARLANIKGSPRVMDDVRKVAPPDEELKIIVFKVCLSFTHYFNEVLFLTS